MSKRPRIKQTPRIKGSFFVLIRDDPTCSPIGCIAISAPKLKKPIPTIKIIAEIIKTINSYGVKLIIGVNDKINTINVTGNTEMRASFILDIN